MDNSTHLGLDVHKDTIAVAILRPSDLALNAGVFSVQRPHRVSAQPKPYGRRRRLRLS